MTRFQVFSIIPDAAQKGLEKEIRHTFFKVSSRTEKKVSSRTELECRFYVGLWQTARRLAAVTVTVTVTVP